MKKYKSEILNIFFIIIGTVIMAFAFNVFMLPNNVSPSGFSGLSALICFFLAKVGIIIPTSAVYLLLNVILYAIAYKLLGKKFALMALIGIISYSAMLEVISYIPLVYKEDLLLSAIYGGSIMGFGIGLVIRNNGSTGGSDLLAITIRSKTHILTTGQIMLAVDIFVLVLSCFAYGIGSLLYSIILLSLASFVTDLVIEGATGVRAYYIFTSKKQEICEAIYKEIGRGVTEIKAEGMYSHTEKDILLCLLNKYRAPRLKALVSDIDNDAFVFCTNVSEVIGRGFSAPVKKKTRKKGELPQAVIETAPTTINLETQETAVAVEETKTESSEVITPANETEVKAKKTAHKSSAKNESKTTKSKTEKTTSKK